jgi:signal transduction histidine kinase/putative methionine-R-sulfoxide reductase with GAF domain
MYKTVRALEALRQCNRVLVRAADEAELLQSVCRLIVEMAGYCLAWVGFAAKDDRQSVVPAGQAGFEKGYLEIVNVTWADSPRGRGPVGTAIRTGKACVIKDIATDPCFAPWRDEAVRRGYASCVGLPLLAGREAFGALTIYAPEPNAFDEKEVALLAELTDNLAYGITTLRTRAEKDQAEKALKLSHDELEQRVTERTAELAEVNARLEKEITERLRAEKVIQESQNRYRILFEESPLSLWEEDFSRVKDFLDSQRAAGVTDFREFLEQHFEAVMQCVDLVRVSDVNKATLKILEASNKEELLDRFGDLLTGQAMGVFREELIALAQGERHFEAESAHRSLSGKMLQVAIYLGVVPGCEQSLSKILVSMLDITDRKQAEAKLEHEKQVLRQLLDAHEKHRQLIAFELHDGVIQLLTGSVMCLEGAIGGLRGRSPEETQAVLEKIVKLLRDSLAEARRLMHGLRPRALDEAGLLAAIDSLVEDAYREGPAQIQYTHDVDFDRLAPPLETAIFRIVQEGLTNARRHSHSPKIRIALAQHDHRLRIEIEDWGKGFDPEQIDQSRFGLKGIRERAELFGGEADIRTVLGQGTCITVELPLVEAAEQEE